LARRFSADCRSKRPRNTRRERPRPYGRGGIGGSHCGPGCPGSNDWRGRYGRGGDVRRAAFAGGGNHRNTLPSLRLHATQRARAKRRRGDRAALRRARARHAVAGGYCSPPVPLCRRTARSHSVHVTAGRWHLRPWARPRAGRRGRRRSADHRPGNRRTGAARLPGPLCAHDRRRSAFRRVSVRSERRRGTLRARSAQRRRGRGLIRRRANLVARARTGARNVAAVGRRVERDGILSRRADVDFATTFDGGFLRAGAGSTSSTGFVSGGDLARHLDLAHVAYATSSRRSRTFVDLSESSLHTRLLPANVYAASYLDAGVRVERPGPTTVAYGATLTQQNGSYGETYAGGLALSERVSSETLYAEAQTGTAGLAATAGLALSDVSARGAVLVPSATARASLGHELYARAGFSESLRVPSLLEALAAPVRPTSRALERGQLTEAAFGFNGNRLRAESLVFQQFLHGIGDYRLRGAGLSAVWQAAPQLSVRAWTLHDAPSTTCCRLRRSATSNVRSFERRTHPERVFDSTRSLIAKRVAAALQPVSTATFGFSYKVRLRWSSVRLRRRRGSTTSGYGQSSAKCRHALGQIQQSKPLRFKTGSPIRRGLLRLPEPSNR